MQVKCDNPATKKLVLAEFGGYSVTFSKNGFATVTDDVGRYLVRHFGSINEVVKEKKKASAKTGKKAATAAAEPEEGD